MDVLRNVRQTVERFRLLSPGETVVVGVSGGPDSLCLLHVLTQLKEDYRLTLHVAHLNHLIRGEEAEADAIFVAALAACWNLPATIESRDVAALARERKLSLEEAARQARYAFLAKVAGEIGAESVAVGHNADDQTESVIMHWLRGAGLAGLRGMLPATRMETLRLETGDLKSLPLGLRLIRPLLEVTRAEIEAYLRKHGLHPRFDLSNLDTTYFRNRLRRELIPYLESYNPNIREVVRRSARIIADDYELLRRETERAWSQAVTSESERAITFNLASWRALPTSLQRATLREAVHRLRRSLRNINWIHIEDALLVLQRGSTGAQATLPQGLMLTVGYSEFTIADEDYSPSLPDWPLLHVERLKAAIPGLTPLPETNWALRAEIAEKENIPSLVPKSDWEAFLDYERAGQGLILRRRRPGDRFQPLGMGGHWKLLRAFLIERKIPEVLREGIPLLTTAEGQIAWVAGLRIDERFKVMEETKSVLHLEFVKQSL